MVKKLTTDEFIAKAKAKHGDKYDYSKAIYVSNKIKIKIICSKHGEFEQAPGDHYRYGCKKCGNQITAHKQQNTKSEFIKKAKKIHGDKYDYSNMDYMGSKIKIKIVCMKHGIFEQNPNSHLQGQGCNDCANEKLSTDRRMSLHDFIKRGKNIHGDNTFDYSEIKNLKNLHSRVPLKCNICHSKFNILAHSHFKSGCNNCANKNTGLSLRKTTKQYINEARKIHGNKYDYSKVKYTTAKSKIKIICKIHGLFEQEALSHLSGCGCLDCGIIKRARTQSLTTDIFIDNAKKIHGDKYDYSKVQYFNAKTKVNIQCNEHGKFRQMPDTHLSGCGCPKCGKERISEKRLLGINEFIKRANGIHGNNTYDYSKFEYINSTTKGKIICSIHGIFEQSPDNHLNGTRCPKCYGTYRPTTDEWIEKAIKIHGNKYEYKKVNYITSKIKVTITCKIHGNFEQTPSDHLSGYGCPKCSNNGTSKIAQEWIDLLLVKQPELRHFYHEKGEFNIPKTNYKADAYNKETKTIYEFHGDFWHGNSEVFNHKLMNNVCKKTFGQLYKRTIKKQRECEELGYTYKSIWENDWIKGKMALKRIQNNFRKKQMLKKFPYQCEKCNYKCKFIVEYDRHCNSILHKTGKRGIKKNKVNRVCQICKLYEASCNTNMKNHILINHKTAKDREKEYPNYCKTCDYGSFSKKLFDKHLTTKKHKKKEDMVKKLKDIN